MGARAAELPAAPPASPSDSLPVATDARLGGDETQTRFVMDFNRKIDLRAFTLADPYRVVVDIPQVVFQLPSKTGETGRGLIKAFRFGLVMQGGSRLVFDLAKPAKIEKAFVVDSTETAPARLVLDLAPTDRESFLRRTAADNRTARADLPRVDAPAVKEGDQRPLVVLDPGHGGIDTGTKGPSGEEEKDIVLNFAQRLRERLEKSGKYRVLLTRTDDTFVALADRVRIARDAGATLFVSIHADSLPHGEGDAQGASIYTLSDTATDSEAARLAEKENRADVIAGVDLKSEPDDVAGILIDLAERETKSLSTQFAHKLAGEMKAVMRMHKKPLKSAGFRVLRAPDVPSVLVELGYVSNRQDLQSLLSETWRNRTSDSMAQVIETFLSSPMAGAHTGSN
ncbi:MAG TPA: N-acetylmuramoyl-L-alanine amidase [Xanthobacteraceae bacterium]|nr:N-acetylmuramoyl-L-alanine amidase [Xanthobacteraceae bacterium]